MTIRVALYGNVANNLGELASALALTGQVEATLLVDTNTSRHGQEPPSSIEYTIVERNSWLSARRPRKSPLISYINSNRFDVAVVSGTGIALLPYLKCRTIAAPIGFDLTVLPLPLSARNMLKALGFVRDELLFSGLQFRKRLFWGLLGHLQFRGLLAASDIMAIDSAPFKEAVARLQIDRKRRLKGLQPVRWVPRWIPIDVGVFSRQAWEDWAPEAKKLRAEYSFVVFHPSRLMIKRTHDHYVTGQWKNSDAVLRGFAKFINQLPEAERSSVCLALLDRDPHFSPDIEEARILIRDLGIEPYIEWIAPHPGKVNLTRVDLLSWYSAADVGVGSLGRPWYGSVAVEFLSCSVPLIANYDPDIDANFWGESFPALRASDEDTMSTALLLLYRDDHLRNERARSSRLWVERTHSHKVLGELWLGWLRNGEAENQSQVGR